MLRAILGTHINKYILGIATIGLPKINPWATKYVTKRPIKLLLLDKNPHIFGQFIAECIVCPFWIMILW